MNDTANEENRIAPGNCIRVSLILDFLASGWTTREVLDNYSGIEGADILAEIA